MIKTLDWKKGIFSNEYELYSQDQQVGTLKDSAFSMDAVGKLDDTHIKFKKKGAFKRDVDIIDLKIDSVIGKITFNAWSSKAEIELNRKKVQCKSDNIWGNKWIIKENDEKIIRFKNSSTKGTIESNCDPLLILSGLYIINYFMQMLAVMIVCMTVIIL